MPNLIITTRPKSFPSKQHSPATKRSVTERSLASRRYQLETQILVAQEGGGDVDGLK